MRPSDEPSDRIARAIKVAARTIFTAMTLLFGRFGHGLATLFTLSVQRVRARRLTHSNPIHPITIIAASALTMIASAAASAAPGNLDPTFSSDGKVTTAFFAEANASATINAIAVQPDGKIVAAGSASRSQTSGAGSGSEFALARYNADGTLDTGFSGDGKVTTDIFGGQDNAYGVAVQPDGKVIAVGSANINAASFYTRFTLVRYNANGSLDASFGSAGIVSTDFFGTENVATSVSLQADGKIVVAGIAHDGSANRFALARYNGDGSLDTIFGTGGKVTTVFFGFNDGAAAVALQADGRIVVVGHAYPGGANDQFAVARYNPDGSLDASFGADGKVTTDFFGANDIGQAVVLQGDGKIVAAGMAYPAGSGIDEFALARYNADGSLDPTFDGDGKTTLKFSSAYVRRLSAAGQADGKIVAASWGVDGATGFDVFSLARFNVDGSLDSSFGVAGKVTTNILGSQNQALAVAVQPDGRIVAAGSAYSTSLFYSLFALARYTADGVVTPPDVRVSALSVSPASVVGGTSSAGTVTLTAPAPAGGMVVTLADDSLATSVPTSVTVPEGTTSATFTVTTTSVTAATTAAISGTAGGATASASLTVNPAPPGTPAAPTLLSPATGSIVSQPVTLDWTDVTHAASYEVQVDTTSTLAAPFTANPRVAVSQVTLSGLPAQRLWWRVRGINSAGVAGPFSATRRFTPQAAPAAASLSALTVSPASVAGPAAATGTVTLTSAAPAGGAVVTLASSNSGLASVPATVTVAAGATTATFSVTTTAVAANSGATLTGTYEGVSRTATLTVTPPPPPASLSALTFNPPSVTGSNSSTGTVTLTSAAPAGGALVTLADDSAATTVPGAVTVAAGATAATFTVTTSTVVASTTSTITAAYDGVARTATLAVNPASANATLTVTATGRAGERVLSAPTGITVLVGTTNSASFAVNTAITLSVSNGRDALWSGACSSGGNKSKTCTFTITGNAAVTGNVQ